jgi:hypothetical protein
MLRILTCLRHGSCGFYRRRWGRGATELDTQHTRIYPGVSVAGDRTRCSDFGGRNNDCAAGACCKCFVACLVAKRLAGAADHFLVLRVNFPA